MEQLDSMGEMVADLVWASKGDELAVEVVEGKLKLARHQVVGAFQDLERFGHGKFVPGRRSHPSRFIRTGTRPAAPQTPGVLASTPAESTPATQGSDDTSLGSIPDQVFVLKRDKPFRFMAPGDLTKAEAERIARWLDLVASE